MFGSTSVTEKGNIGIYYGWVIVFAAFITLGISFGIWYSYSVFILAVIREFNWSTAAASSVFSIFIISHSTFAMAAGYLQDRFGPRVVVPAGSLLLAVSLIVTSWSENLWHFQLTYGVFAGAGISLTAFVSHSAFLPKWFERKRGLALGIATAGIGLGMLLIVPFSEKMISAYGWRSAYRILAAIVLFIVAPLNLILGRKSPEAISQHPDGDIPGNPRGAKPSSWVMEIIDKKWAAIDWDLLKASRTLTFWYLIGAFGFISFAFQGVLLHAVAAMVDAQLSKSTAAYVFGLAGIMGSVGKILFGCLSDKLGRERAKFIADVIAILGILALTFISSAHSPMTFIFAICFGIGYGAAAPLIPAITADIFIGRHYGLIFSFIAIGGGIGAAVGTYTVGLLRDTSGDYTAGFIVCCLSLAISCILVFLAAPGKVRRMKKIRFSS